MRYSSRRAAVIDMLLRVVVGTALLGLAVLGLVVTGRASPAHAVDNGVWAVVPTSSGDTTVARTSFAFDVDPAMVLDDSITIQNLSDEPLTFRIYAASGFNTNDGSLAIEGPDATPEDAARWITLATNEWDLPPGQQVDIPFVLNVPADASPGDHVAGIAAMNIATVAADTPSNVQIDVRKSVAVPMFVRVSGALSPSLRISDVAADHHNAALPGAAQRTDVSLTLTNDGNVRLSPEVSATIDPFIGPGVHRLAETQIASLLPGSSITVHLSTDDGPMVGPATIDVKVSADSLELHRAASVWNVPWLAIFALVFLAAVFIGVRRARRRRSVPIDDGDVVPVEQPALVV